MAEEHPGFNFEVLRHGSRTWGRWTGGVQPIKTVDGNFELLDDLCHDRDVMVAGDEVQHIPFCTSDHCRHDWMNKLEDLRVLFQIEVRYDGSRALPRCWVLSPRILKRRHMWADNAICAFLASDGTWIWHNHTVADFIPHALIWLVKWTVYDQAGEWIGAEHDNSPGYHIETVRPKALCWCGSGEQYRKCHRKEEIQSVGLF